MGHDRRIALLVSVSAVAAVLGPVALEASSAGPHHFVLRAATPEHGPSYDANGDADEGAEDWPVVGGDAARTFGRAGAAPRDAAAWYSDLHGSVLPPAVVEGRVVIAAGADESVVRALHPWTGDVLWERPVAGGIDTPPVVADGLVVYAEGGDTHAIVHRIDVATGEPLEDLSVEGDAQPRLALVDGLALVASGGAVRTVAVAREHATWRADGVPAAVGVTAADGVVVVAGQRGNVTALDAVTGAVRWTTWLNGEVLGAPAFDGRRIALVLGLSDEHDASLLVALDAATAESAWSYGVEPGFVSSPAMAGTFVLAVTGDGKLYAVERGERRWTYEPTAGDVSAVAVLDGTAYAGTSLGRVHAVHLSSGEETWSAVVGRGPFTSVTVAEGMIFATNEHGRLYAYPVDDEPVEDAPVPAGGAALPLLAALAAAFVAIRRRR